MKDHFLFLFKVFLSYLNHLLIIIDYFFNYQYFLKHSNYFHFNIHNLLNYIRYYFSLNFKFIFNQYYLYH